MKEEEKYDLSEAVKRHYNASPLKIDLSRAAAKRVFDKQEKKDRFWDGLRVLVPGFCGLAACLIAVFWLDVPLFVCWLALPLAAYFGLSMQETAQWKYRAENLVYS